MITRDPATVYVSTASRSPSRSTKKAPRWPERSCRMSDFMVSRLYCIIGPERQRAPGINHAPLAHEVDVIDELQRERGVLLDQQDRQAFLLQLRHCLPRGLDDDRREPLRRLVHDKAVGVGHEAARDGEHLLLAARERLRALRAPLFQPG